MFEDEDEVLSLEDDLYEGQSSLESCSNPRKNPVATLRSCFKTPESPGRSRKRKFPGPAGLLPDSSTRKREDLPISSKDDSAETQVDEQDTDLFGELWREMLADYQTSEDEIHPYRIAKLKEQSLPGSSKKTPVLIVVLKSIDSSSPDPSCSLVDPSGSINGMIHRDVMDNYRNHLSMGSVLVLRNVAILMTLRNHYVNVTVNNLLSLYHLSSSPPRRIIVSKEHPRSVSQILEDSKCSSRLKDLNDSVEKKRPADNPFLKPVDKSPPPAKDFLFKKPKPSPPRARSSHSVENSEALLDGLDEDSLFGDF